MRIKKNKIQLEKKSISKLIGNKLDEIEEVGVHIDRDEVIAFARKEGITYIETSPKSKELIENTFLKLTSKIISSSKKK